MVRPAGDFVLNPRANTTPHRWDCFGSRSVGQLYPLRGFWEEEIDSWTCGVEVVIEPSPTTAKVQDRDTLNPMRVRVLFFGMLKDSAGKSSDEIELKDNASVRDLLVCCQSRIPWLTESLGSLAVAVNQQYAGPDTKLKAGDEVALLPPVSGGAPDVAGETPPRRPEPALSRPEPS